MKAIRGDGGYVFHGGCNGCTNPLHVCPGCQYMEADWSLPSLNPEDIQKKAEDRHMRKEARKAASIVKEVEGK